MKNKMVIAGVAIVALLIVGALFMLGGGDGGPGGDRDREMGQDRDPTISSDGGNIPLVKDDPREALERYRKWAQYPPTSRPLHAGMVDLVDPFNAERPAIGVITEKAEGCRKEGYGVKCDKPAKISNTMCKLTPQSSISVGRGDFGVTLYCENSADTKRPRVPIKNIKAKVYRKLFKKDTPSLPPVAIGDDGNGLDKQAGDLIYTFTVRPQARDWGYLFLETEFEVDGKPHVQRANWFSTPQKVAEFGKTVRDSARGGHLFVDIPVTVYKEGYYKIDANLQQKDGDREYVASASWEGRLEAGQKTVPLRFWGKVIRDRNVNGPYLVRSIRGRRDNSPVTPDRLRKSLESGQPITDVKHTEPLYEYIEPLGEDHETQSYESRDFTDKEWESPQKERRIKYLEGVASGGGS